MFTRSDERLASGQFIKNGPKDYLEFEDSEDIVLDSV